MSECLEYCVCLATSHFPLAYLASSLWKWIYSSLLDCLLLYVKLKDVTIVQLNRVSISLFSYKSIQIRNIPLSYP